MDSVKIKLNPSLTTYHSSIAPSSCQFPIPKSATQQLFPGIVTLGTATSQLQEKLEWHTGIRRSKYCARQRVYLTDGYVEHGYLQCYSMLGWNVHIHLFSSIRSGIAWYEELNYTQVGSRQVESIHIIEIVVSCDYLLLTPFPILYSVRLRKSKERWVAGDHVIVVDEWKTVVVTMVVPSCNCRCRDFSQVRGKIVLLSTLINPSSCVPQY